MVNLRIEFLVATINRTSCDFLYSMFKNVSFDDCYVLVINQCIDIPVPKSEIVFSHDNVVVYSVDAKGTSCSRNMAIERMRGDIGIFADDDVVYKKDVLQIIRAAYSQYPLADIITFQAQYFSGKYLKEYKKQPYVHNKYSLKNVSDIEISFRKEMIQEKRIIFNTLFGLGAKFPLGEYLIFLKDCNDRKCKLVYVPQVIILHPDCLHSGLRFDELYEVGRGAVYAKVSPILFPILIFYFALKKFHLYKSKHSFSKELSLLFLGSYRYFKMILNK